MVCNNGLTSYLAFLCLRMQLKAHPAFIRTKAYSSDVRHL